MSGIVGNIGSRSGIIGETEGGEQGSWTPVFKKGTTTLTVGTKTGHYYKLGDLLYISFYGYNAYYSSITTTGRYTVGGLPYAIAAGGTYPFISVGYGQINGTNYAEATPHRLASLHNPDNKSLMLYGSYNSTNWTSSHFELSGSGVLRLL